MSSKDVLSKMVNLFLQWKLPQDFVPDCYITFKHPGGDAMWPTGTNLFHAGQAQAMLEQVTAPLQVENEALRAELGHTKTLLGSNEFQVRDLQVRVRELHVQEKELRLQLAVIEAELDKFNGKHNLTRVARVDDLERGGRVRALALGLGLDDPLYALTTGTGTFSVNTKDVPNES